MANKKYDRYTIRFAVPLEENPVGSGNWRPVNWFRQDFVDADFNLSPGVSRINAFKRILKRIQSHCEKVNSGTPAEEDTTAALHHECNHELGLPCTLDIDLSTQDD